MSTAIILSPHVYVPIQQNLERFPGNYLEIGLFNGIGFVEVARAFPNKICYGVDPFIEDGNTIGGSRKNTGERITDQFETVHERIKGYNNIRLHITTSHEFKDSLSKEKIAEYNISCVLIDGNHHYEYVVNDYELAMLTIGDKPGIIIFDDLKIDDVQRAVNEFKEKYANRIQSSTDISGVAEMIELRPNQS